MQNAVAGVPGLDPTLPDVALIIGGEKRHLCFDFNAIVLAEKQTGINLLQSATMPTAGSLRAMLWASLLRSYPKLTIEEVGGWITMTNAPGIYEALTLAWFGSNMTAEGEAEGEAQAQATPA